MSRKLDSMIDSREQQVLQAFSGRIEGTISALVIPALLLAFFGCSTLSVRTDYDRKVDFSRYRVFNWVGARDRPDPPPEWLDQLVRQEIEQRLLAKGYQDANGKEPDFLVAYDVALEERTVQQPVFSRTGPVSGPASIIVGSPVLIPPVSGDRMTLCPYTIREGTLLIDFFDAKSNQLVWRGCAVDVVSDRSDAERKIPRAVKQVLNTFPPK